MKSYVARVAPCILFLASTAASAQPAVTVKATHDHTEYNSEVGAVDPAGEPRLWGRGRPNNRVYTYEDPPGEDCQKGETTFGLSRHAVDWGSAADACPAGTWVCRHEEVEPCDTNRPDSEVDRTECDGTEVDLPAGEHQGWLAGASTQQKFYGLSKREHSLGIITTRTCESLPVWCCRETSPAEGTGSSAIGTAELTVEGEIRALRAALDVPRLWGRGRPHTVVHGLDTSTGDYCDQATFISYGLSRLAVDWGSAADACPKGTWVCGGWRIGACDTDRPDGGSDTLDYLDCAGNPASWDEGMHRGWTADALWSDDLTNSGVAAIETGTEEPFPTCNSLPVWCCWYRWRSPGSGTAEVAVEGEVRTVDSSGSPRTWGRGRSDARLYYWDSTASRSCAHESTRFGLSLVAVDWGSAADACPIGTWVCRSSEMEPCDTDRPDSSIDAMTCSGGSINLGADHHAGWVADASFATQHRGRYKFEDEDVIYTSNTCTSLPTWCCWEE